MFFSRSSAMREIKRMRAAGCRVHMAKKWYGWVIKDEISTPGRADTFKFIIQCVIAAAAVYLTAHVLTSIILYFGG